MKRRAFLSILGAAPLAAATAPHPAGEHEAFSRELFRKGMLRPNETRPLPSRPGSTFFVRAGCDLKAGQITCNVFAPIGIALHDAKFDEWSEQEYWTRKRWDELRGESR